MTWRPLRYLTDQERVAARPVVFVPVQEAPVSDLRDAEDVARAERALRDVVAEHGHVKLKDSVFAEADTDPGSEQYHRGWEAGYEAVLVDGDELIRGLSRSGRAAMQESIAEVLDRDNFEVSTATLRIAARWLRILGAADRRG